MEPCRGSDSGSNPDSGAPFLPLIDERSPSATRKECKLECKLYPQSNSVGMSNLFLPFTQEDLYGYLNLRSEGLASKTIIWLKKAAELLWGATRGTASISTLQNLRNDVLKKYRDTYAKRKVLQFARAFLSYMSKISFDQRYAAFDLFLELPRSVKQRKHVTSRIVTKEDVENVLRALENAYDKGRIDESRYLNYKALTLFGAYTGQRPLATIARLIVGQFREAVNHERPSLNVLPEQDKIRMQHYCPLHPQVAEAVEQLLNGQPEDELIFKQLSFQAWLKHTDIRLLHGGARIVNGDLRKFCEQHGDIIQWDQSNKNYILTHGVSGVDWRFYKHPLPDHVYDVYMKYWGNVTFKS
jgi:integrase